MTYEKDGGWSDRVQGLLFLELRTKTGYSHGNPRSVDAFHVWDVPSADFHRTAYEVKVSRADFMREVRNPAKRVDAMRLSNQFYFVAPAGLVEADEVPRGCGLVEVYGRIGDRTVVKAPVRNRGAQPTWGFACSLARARSYEG